MKRQHIASMVIFSASIFVVGITLAAQDKNTLKSPSGIAFSEFNGYEQWQMVASSQAPTTVADAVRRQIPGASSQFWEIPC